MITIAAVFATLPASPSVALYAVGILVLLVVATVAHVLFWTAKLRYDLPYASQQRIATADGSAFDLRRVTVPPPGSTLPPILMVHGLAANHRNIDLDEEASLARHLANNGRDVWLITLRSGRSDRRFAEHKLATFSAMARYDVPGAIDAVLRATNSEKLDYVGFSMGGMLALATIGTTVPTDRIRRLVIIGSPGRVAVPLPLLSRLRGVPSWIAPPSPFRWPARLVAFAVEWFTTPLHRLPINPDNVAPGKLRRTMVNMIEDVPVALNRELAGWAFSDGQLRVDGEPVAAAIALNRQPARFFAGAADHIAPAGAVAAGFELWGGADKTFTVLGTAHGYGADYGHGDLAIGRNAAEEVFAPIERFLAEEPA